LAESPYFELSTALVEVSERERVAGVSLHWNINNAVDKV
jgi:hypothetical protein